jgi:hypothetical protein
MPSRSVGMFAQRHADPRLGPRDGMPPNRMIGKEIRVHAKTVAGWILGQERKGSEGNGGTQEAR